MQEDQDKYDPLSINVVPNSPGEFRNKVIAMSVEHVMPETAAVDSTGTVSSTRAREVLQGYFHFLYSKVHDRKDRNRYKGIPQQFHNQEPTLPMLHDWLGNLFGDVMNEWNIDTSFRLAIQSHIKEAEEYNYPQEAREGLKILTESESKAVSIIFCCIQHAVHEFIERPVEPETPYDPSTCTEMDSGWYPVRMLYMNERMDKLESQMKEVFRALQEFRNQNPGFHFTEPTFNHIPDSGMTTNG